MFLSSCGTVTSKGKIQLYAHVGYYTAKNHNRPWSFLTPVVTLDVNYILYIYELIVVSSLKMPFPVTILDYM